MKRLFWPIVAYLVIIALVFGRALLPGPHEMIWGDDIHRQYYFYRQFFNSFLREGIWPWWNPYIFSGTPFIANPIVNIWYPPTWLFVLLPLNIAYSWHLALHILWAMLGMYVLISNFKFQISNWENRKRYAHVEYSRYLDLGAWIGGLVFGLSGFFTARIWAGHVDVIAAASWLPWVVGAFWQLIQTHPTKLCSSIILSAVVVALQLLAGYQTMAFFTLEAVFIFVLFYQCHLLWMSFPFSFSSSPRTRGPSVKKLGAGLAAVTRPLLRVIIAAAIGLGLAGIQIIPVQEFFRQSIRTFDFPYRWNSYGSLTIESLKQFLNPFVFGDQLTYHGPPPNYAEHAFFVGRVGLVLAVVFLLRRLPRVPRSPRLLMFGFLAFFGLWVSLGPNAPIDLQYILWKIVPMYRYLRLPPRHLILVAFGLSGMVGMAINLIISKSQILNSKQYQNSNFKSSKRFFVWNFEHWDLFRIWNLGFRISILVAVIGVATEMILYARHFIALKPIPETRHDAELIHVLSPPRCRSFSTPEVADDCLYRVLTNFGAWIPPRDSFDFDAGMQERVFNATGYDPSILRSYYEFIDRANGRSPGASILDHDVQVPYLNVFSKATDFLGIKYILVPRAYDPLFGVKSDRFVLVREDASRDYRLYENKTAKPRFFLEEGKEGRVSVLTYSPNEIVLAIDAPEDATLVSSEVYYPGWEGFVDGQKVNVQKANHAFRALFVPAGRHTVIYRYSPRIFLIGGAVSLASLIGLIIISVIHSRANSTSVWVSRPSVKNCELPKRRG